MKKKDERRSNELRDRPVPPVKGQITEPTDVIRRPDTVLGQGLLSGPQAVTEPDNWL